MKNICSITQDYYPDDLRIRKECEVLIQNGYSVNVICLRNKEELNYEEINGVKVYRVNLMKKRASKVRYVFEYLYFFVLTFFKLNKLDLTNKFSLIEVSSPPDFLVFITFFQKLRGAKIILNMHEIMPEFFMSKFKKKEKHLIVKFLKLIEKISLKYADEVITINEPIKQIFKKRSIPHKNIIVIMNTIDESIVKPISRQNSHNFNLIYHGYLANMYGLDIAIRALKILSEYNDNFKFYIFGEGPEEKYLSQLIYELGLNNCIFLKGKLDFQEMMKYLANMTIGILPMRKDSFLDLSFSNKLSEYIFFKIPVIVSNINTVQYYFSEDEITLFLAEDFLDLSEKISFAYNNPNTMARKANKAFEKYQSIKWSVMAKKYINLVNSLSNTERNFSIEN